jgi:predicted nucleic acid-binding protein
MILLDTNVVSEAMTREPHPRVRGWLDDQSAETLFISSIIVAELPLGIGAMPISRSRRARLERASQRPTATSPRSLPRMGSPWRRAT